MHTPYVTPPPWKLIKNIDKDRQPDAVPKKPDREASRGIVRTLLDDDHAYRHADASGSADARGSADDEPWAFPKNEDMLVL